MILDTKSLRRHLPTRAPSSRRHYQEFDRDTDQSRNPNADEKDAQPQALPLQPTGSTSYSQRPPSMAPSQPPSYRERDRVLAPEPAVVAAPYRQQLTVMLEHPTLPSTARLPASAYGLDLPIACQQEGKHKYMTQYGLCGVTTSILLFPIGLLALLFDRKRRCSRCGHVFEHM